MARHTLRESAPSNSDSYSCDGSDPKVMPWGARRSCLRAQKRRWLRTSASGVHHPRQRHHNASAHQRTADEPKGLRGNTCSGVDRQV
eukprot:364918-Chlamydomonas_euryale.AAC.2